MTDRSNDATYPLDFTYLEIEALLKVVPYIQTPYDEKGVALFNAAQKLRRAMEARTDTSLVRDPVHDSGLVPSSAAEDTAEQIGLVSDDTENNPGPRGGR